MILVPLVFWFYFENVYLSLKTYTYSISVVKYSFEVHVLQHVHFMLTK